MTESRIPGRTLKKKILKLLKSDDIGSALDAITELPARKAVNPLFSFFYSGDEIIKWRAVTAMGAVVSNLAGRDIESARVVMRRLIWNLNDESGGIGWGSPEALGEIMARNEKLAEEYAFLLVSHINPDGNYLEHEVLQRGALWGFGRLAHARPERVKNGAPFLMPFLEKEDAMLRGLAVWAACPLDDEILKPRIKRLIHDDARIRIFIDTDVLERTVGELARNESGRTLPK